MKARACNGRDIKGSNSRRREVTHYPAPAVSLHVTVDREGRGEVVEVKDVDPGLAVAVLQVLLARRVGCV